MKAEGLLPACAGGWHPIMETAQWWLRVTRSMDGVVVAAEGKLDLHNPPPG